MFVRYQQWLFFSPFIMTLYGQLKCYYFSYTIDDNDQEDEIILYCVNNLLYLLFRCSGSKFHVHDKSYMYT